MQTCGIGNTYADGPTQLTMTAGDGSRPDDEEVYFRVNVVGSKI